MGRARDRNIHVGLNFFDDRHSRTELHANPAELVRSSIGAIQVAEAHRYTLHVGKSAKCEMQPTFYMPANRFGDGELTGANLNYHVSSFAIRRSCSGCVL